MIRCRLLALVAPLALVAACGGSPAPRADEPTRSPTPSPSPTPSRDARPAVLTPGPEPSDGRPRQATMAIPTLGLRELVVEPYRGTTDDLPGTRIQDRGRAASPHGPDGGVGPGGVGNYLVTAHRTSSTRAFERLPELVRGDRVQVRVGERTYVYEVRRTRETSFRSTRSLAEQRAAVPGRPDARPTRAMITLSTCATREDHAAGNYWSDALHNPEHRIDKVGVLVAVRG